MTEVEGRDPSFGGGLVRRTSAGEPGPGWIDADTTVILSEPIGNSTPGAGP